MPAISFQNATSLYGENPFKICGVNPKNVQNVALSWWKAAGIKLNAQTKIVNSKKLWQNKLSAAVLELEDRTDSKSVVPKGRVGSTPTRGTFVNKPAKKDSNKSAGKNVAGPMEADKHSGYRD